MSASQTKIIGAAGEKTERLEKSVTEGDAYAALQTYKTFHARAAKKGNYAAAVDFLRSGSIVMLKNSHLTAGTELALLLVETLEEGKMEQNDDIKEVLLAVSKAFEEVDGPKEKKAEAAKNEARFLKSCIAWSSLKAFGQHPKGDPEFHYLAAKAKILTGDLPGASTHFLHAKQPKEFASFLYQWSSLGYQNERDLFLSRVILQLLALENLKEANMVHDTFIAICTVQKTPMKDTPLANFIRFLLKTLERDAYPLFKMLCEKYQASINRDSSFQLFLDRIQEIYFGVKPQKRGIQAMMDSMLGMFGGN